MQEAIYTLLQAGLSFPVSWGSIGDGVGTPRCALYTVSGVRDMHMNGKGLIDGRIQADCFGETYAEAILASRDVRGILEGYSGGDILGVFLDSIRDGFGDDAGLLYRVSLTFSVHYRD